MTAIVWAPEQAASVVFFLCGCAAGWQARRTLAASVPDRIDLRPGQSLYRGFRWRKNVLEPRNYRSGRASYWIRRWLRFTLLHGVCWLIAFLLAATTPR